MWNLDKIMFLLEKVFTLNGFDGQKCDHFWEKVTMDFFFKFCENLQVFLFNLYVHVDIFVCFQKHGRISIFNANYIVSCYANSIKSPTYLKVKHFWSFQGRPVDLSTFSAFLYLILDTYAELCYYFHWL